jgi:LCP family protein required for cell wall assembly
MVASVLPGLAALASAIVPGVGQLMVGRRRRGWVLLSVSAALAAAGGWLVAARPLMLATWWVQPTALRWLLVGNGVLLAFRVYAAADAYVAARQTSGPASNRPGIVALGLVATAAIAVPHGVFGYYDVIEQDLIESVFAAPTTTSTTATTVATTVAVTVAPPSTGEGTTTATTAAPPPSTTTTTRPPRIWDGVERLNILLLGGDSGPGRIGVRTDTIIVASIDPQSGAAALFSIPRNLKGVPLPAELGLFSCNCYPDIVNALWDYATRLPNPFQGPGPPGAEALRLAIGELLDLDIHYFALVDLNGFVDLVDAFGGLDITVTERVYDPSYPVEDGSHAAVEFLPGRYHMDGHDSLAYARVRHDSSDYNRMARQRCVLQAAVAQAEPLQLLRSFPRVAEVIKDSVVTDIPVDRLPDLVELIPRLDPSEVVAVGFVPPSFGLSRDADGFPHPDIAVVRATVETAITLEPEAAREALGLDAPGTSCGITEGAPAE